MAASSLGVSFGPGPGTETLWRQKDRAAQKNGPRRTAFMVAPGSRKTVDSRRIKASGPDGPIDSFKMTGSYQGEWRNNKRDGFGTLTTASGTKYEGEWHAGRRHGRGTQWVVRDGELRKQYAGDWAEGRREGFGAFFFDNGDRYEGEFVGGKRHGRGTMVYADGSVYEGSWEDGLRHGVGVLTSSDGDAYEGHFARGEKHGAGRLFYRRTKKVYEGEWVDGSPRCGVFSAVPGADGAGEDEDDDFVLPPLELRDPDDVIIGAVEAAREATARARDGEEGGGVDADVAGLDGAADETMAEGDGAAWAEDALTEAEVDELWRAFASAPGGADGDPGIAGADLGPVLRELGLDPGEDDVERILGMAETGPDGRMTFEAFAEVMARLRQ